MEESGLVVFEGLWINRYIGPSAINKKMSPNSGMFCTHHTISWYSWETMDFLDKCLLSADVWKIMIAITIYLLFSIFYQVHFLSRVTRTCSLLFTVKSRPSSVWVRNFIICIGDARKNGVDIWEAVENAVLQRNWNWQRSVMIRRLYKLITHIIWHKSTKWMKERLSLTVTIDSGRQSIVAKH